MVNSLLLTIMVGLIVVCGIMLTVEITRFMARKRAAEQLGQEMARMMIVFESSMRHIAASSPVEKVEADKAEQLANLQLSNMRDVLAKEEAEEKKKEEFFEQLETPSMVLTEEGKEVDLRDYEPLG